MSDFGRIAFRTRYKSALLGVLPTPLHTTTDPNQPALAFRIALKRLSAIGKMGDVVMHKQGAGRTHSLRQSIVRPALQRAAVSGGLNARK